MTFGFYHSMVTIPKDLQEAATNFRLSRWQRFGTLEVPSSMHSLIWNSMMSFGGGWFFVAQSEAITVLNKNIKLPGLGSYMATAVEKGDNTAAIWAIVTMLAIILASDQLVWRPLFAWADKFKMELIVSGQAPQSWLYNFIRRAYLFDWIEENFLHPLSDVFTRFKKRVLTAGHPCGTEKNSGPMVSAPLGGDLGTLGCLSDHPRSHRGCRSCL